MKIQQRIDELRAISYIKNNHMPTKKTQPTGNEIVTSKLPSQDEAASGIINILKSYDADQQNIIIGKVIKETRLHRKEMYDNHRSGAEYYGQSMDVLTKILSSNE